MLYPDINSQKRTQQNTTRYRTALYLRLSREDGDKTESDSIANQRTLLEAYAIDHPELCIVDEFVDDGYSGSNFERPAFQRLFQELEQGTINCILVKDLSRFGRNYIEVGRYLERIFPVMRVRLIAVTDNYDSQSAWKTSDSIMVPMRNLLNDAYCRDISVKIKSQLAVKRKRGDFVGSFAAYGYRKDPANHTKLIVDELAAENVQSIFRWKISGMNNQGIADRLNAKKVSSPAARKLQSGAKLSLHFRKSDEPPWSAKAVDRILHNEVYIGKLVQGKTRRLDYRSKKKMNVPMRDWVIVDNTHEAIIPAEQFELVQRILETETRRPNDAETVALFAGFLYCGDCGSRLVRRSASYKGKRYIYYQCSGSKQNKGSCTSHNLRDEKLYNVVRNALQMQIQIVMEEAEFVESIRQAQQEPYRVRRIERHYSGSNFERPAFQNLFRELEQGTINCVLVKDLSRFGRNYIEVGRYLERIFPVMRVRLIAVTDNYDSQSAWKTSDSIMVPMRNLLNDAYCRDISVKIKSQLAVKRKRGDFVGSFAAYGYQKDPANYTKLIVDELAAETVQDIFRWKISGMNNQSIADRLNAKKVPSPAARKLQSGAKLSLHFRKSDEPPWSAKAVDRILHNEVYIGKLVQGKTRRLDYRSKKKMNVPMRDWVIVDNTHEAIIPAEQFELVRRILETETRRPNDAETVALFAGFLYCGDCGSRLVRRSASYKGKRYIYYQCSGSKQNKGSCTSHNLRDEKLYNIVRNALQMQIQIVMEEAEFVEGIRQAQQEPYRVRRIERQIRQLTAEKAHTQGIKEKLYGDYADEILTREDFLNYNELYSNRIEEYDRKITELEAERQNLQTAPNAYPFLDVYRKYRKLEEITRPMVVELIEKNEVYEGNRVEITFRFHDEIADLLEELHQKQMGQHEVSA